MVMPPPLFRKISLTQALSPNFHSRASLTLVSSLVDILDLGATPIRRPIGVTTNLPSDVVFFDEPLMGYELDELALSLVTKVLTVEKSDVYSL